MKYIIMIDEVIAKRKKSEIIYNIFEHICQVRRMKKK